MKLERWDTREVIFEMECNSQKELVTEALKANANLSYANLSYANLSSAELQSVVGNMREIKSMQIETYTISYSLVTKILHIGCEAHSFEKWELFTDEEIFEMGQGALIWWKKWKDFIFKVIELSGQDT